MTAVILVVVLAAQAGGEGVRESVDRLVSELSSDDIAARDAAERSLIDLGPKAHEALKAHVNHKDAEVRARVGRLLPQSVIVPVAEEIRPILAQIESEKLEALMSGVVELLKKDRKEALETARLCAAKASGRLQYRCRQLADILEGPAAPPLRYGIVVAESECGLEGPIPGLELWISESGEKLVLKDASGVPALRALEGPSDTVSSGYSLSTHNSMGAFVVEPGASRILARDNLARSQSVGSTGSRWGTPFPGARFSLRRTYESNAEGLRKDASAPLLLKRESNVVEFRYR